MVDDVLHPSEVRVALRRHAVLPALVLGEARASPVGHVERRIRQNEIGSQVGMPIIVEGITLRDLASDATDGQIQRAAK